MLAGSAFGMLWTKSAIADCTGAVLTDDLISRFKSRIQGMVILPIDSGYATSRLIFNTRFNPYPVVIVRAVSESDIARTIEFARTNNIALALRSGGHSYIGASGGSGIILDLSLMNEVTSLGGANFRIGSGAQLQNVYGTMRCNGNWTIPSGSCGTVGFGGIAQGGGFGYLQRSHGLTLDRVRSARMVRADGKSVIASPNGDADLHWAIRGAGGGSLGVVTHFDVEAVPYQTIHVKGWYWPLNLADQALNKFISLQQEGILPRSATVALVFNANSAAISPPQCVCVLFSTGTLAEVEAVKQLFVGPGGIPETPGLGFEYDAESPACDPHEMPMRAHYRAKSAMVYGNVPTDTGALLKHWMERRIADPFLTLADYGTINFLTFGGAVADISPNATAFPHRQALLEVQFLGYANTQSPNVINANLNWIRGCYADLFPRLSSVGSGCYVNYCDDDLADSQWPSFYWGENYPRLQQTKLRVDPENFFHGKQSIRLPEL